MIYQYTCLDCKRTFEEVRSVEKRHDVFCCGLRAKKHIATNINTHKDLLYNFETNLKGEDVRIHSKSQYKKLLKEKGLVDVSVSEVRSVREKQANIERKHDLGQLSSRVQRQVQKDGLTNHLKPLLEKCSTKKEG